MDLELLKRFYIVAEEGTIGRAAQKINVAPSAVTRSIGDFEHQLKTQLFERVPKGMQLTQQGERLHAFAKQFLEQADSFEKSFQEKEDEVEGEINIVTTAYLGSEWLAPCLKEFLKKHPKLHIQILIRSENIHPAEGDVAICTLIPHQPHLIQKPLFTAYTRLFASQSYLNKFGVPYTVEDLDSHRLITYKGNHYSPYGSTNWILNVGNKPGASPRKSYFEIESLHGMLNSALQGYGIVEFPDYSKVFDLGLKQVMPELIGPELDIYYVFPQSRKTSRKINLLYEYLSKQKK